MMRIEFAKYIPWIPALSTLICGLLVAVPRLRRVAGVVCVLSILAALVITCGIYGDVVAEDAPAYQIVNAFQWMLVGDFTVSFGYFIDPLTIVMLFVVTGIGTLIAWYANGYMAHDRGFARFFAGVSLFIFAMTTLVMADNLVLLYLGWEGVGLCSYLLIGHYYKYPVAVAAAKKAFIVNRVGDLAFAIGIFLTYRTFGSVEYRVIFEQVIPMVERSLGGQFTPTTAMMWVPFLLMIGAFGKSAQGLLYVWLPDAMAGPTPVSALVHAATMVTAGVFMVARMTPLFELSPYAMPTVAIVGAITCFYAATIALCNTDLKGIFAFSTVSQLGYMFIGVSVLSVGGIFHLATHAFFKALLFLTAGSVMHALAGSLDIRHMSGMGKKMPVTKWLMFAGCLALAGVPFTSGFYSKDLILGDAFVAGLDEHNRFAGWYMTAAVLGIITAGLTAFYTFRLWFKVFTGPEEYHYNGEGYDSDNELEKAMCAVAREEMAEADHGHGDHGHHHAPHEMPWGTMNLPLVVLAIGALGFGMWAAKSGWISDMLHRSTQLSVHTGHAAEHGAPHGGIDPHLLIEIISGALAVGGVLLAGFFFGLRRDLVPKITAPLQPVVNLLYHKYYVDEFYDAVIRRPLRAFGAFLYGFDNLVVMGLVELFGFIPRLAGYSLKPFQSGRLQGYGLGMVAGAAVIAWVIYWATS